MLFVAILLGGFVVINSSTSNGSSKKSIYEYSAMNIDGKDVSLEKYKGEVILIVNTASQCGYTPQYEGLQKIYDKYKDKGFIILGFPTNNFGGQEPGSNEEIKEFCTSKYKVTFPMFAKISVKGEDTHPLYKFLTDKQLNGEFGGDISWNFNKFLTNNKGEIVARFSSKDAPESETVTNAIEKYLSEKQTNEEKKKVSVK
jgi:glutathione peroxidase